jgi:uncharacterized membrane protein YdbT with pleckstrin-like domain
MISLHTPIKPPIQVQQFWLEDSLFGMALISALFSIGVSAGGMNFIFNLPFRILGSGGLVFILVAGIIMAIFVVLEKTIIGPRRYAATVFVLEEDRIKGSYGLIPTMTKDLLFTDIRRVEIVRNLAAKKYNLSVVKLWTGSKNEAITTTERDGTKSTFYVPELSVELGVEDAEWLRSFIMKQKQALK